MTRKLKLPSGVDVEVSGDEDDDDAVTCHCGALMEVCCDTCSRPYRARAYVCPECDDPCRLCGLDERGRRADRQAEEADLARKDILENGPHGGRKVAK